NGEKYFINSDGNRAYTAGYFDQNGNPLLAQLDLPQGVVDFSAGFGDTMSFGATKWLRSKWGIGGVDYSSNYYTVGQAVGFVTPGFGTVAGLRGAAYLGRSHRWLNTGRHWRIGPGVISKAAGAKPFNYGAGRNIPMLRIGNKTPSSLNHFDLRILGK
ncbi:MAG: hypothetical protein K0U59_00705, partial [Gammaproteobacteria bacterium]|nr:hypothetical protein [Gammaproteobacteria bacterium]